MKGAEKSVTAPSQGEKTEQTEKLTTLRPQGELLPPGCRDAGRWNPSSLGGRRKEKRRPEPTRKPKLQATHRWRLGVDSAERRKLQGDRRRESRLAFGLCLRELSQVVWLPGRGRGSNCY